MGGLLVLYLGLEQVGGFSAFMEANDDKLHVILPANHPEIPWTALLLGIWIPNCFYWGLNQFITQRALGSQSLKAAQRGLVFAASIKLLIPFIIVLPGIMAFQLYGAEIANGDTAYPVLIQRILPTGLRGVMFAALFGAVTSTLDSMLNSASTIFTVDLYQRHLARDADPKRIVSIGRVATGILALLACLVAPLLEDPAFGGVFKYIQMFQGFVSPGVVAAFVFGIAVRRAPPVAGVRGPGPQRPHLRRSVAVPARGGLSQPHGDYFRRARSRHGRRERSASIAWAPRAAPGRGLRPDAECRRPLGRGRGGGGNGLSVHRFLVAATQVHPSNPLTQRASPGPGPSGGCRERLAKPSSHAIQLISPASSCPHRVPEKSGRHSGPVARPE